MQISAVKFNISQKPQISFQGHIEQYLNKQSQANAKKLQKELRKFLTDEDPTIEKFKVLVKSIFKDFNFTLKGIEELPHDNIKKHPPIFFAETHFHFKNPETTIFLNIEKIIKQKKQPFKKLNNDSFAISASIAKKYDLNYISSLVDECTNEFKGIEKLDENSVKNGIAKIIKKHDLDVKNIVTDKYNCNNTYIEFLEENKIRTTMLIDFKADKKSIKQGVSHEFNHVLNANSAEYNSNYPTFVKKGIISKHPHLEEKFFEIEANNHDFLDLPIEIKNKKYNELLKKTLEEMDKNDKKSAFFLVENKVKDEALAYSKTPNLEEEYKKKIWKTSTIYSYEPPIGKYFHDFYDYLLSIKNNSNEFQKIIK